MPFQIKNMWSIFNKLYLRVNFKGSAKFVETFTNDFSSIPGHSW